MNSHLRFATILTHLLDEQFSIGPFKIGLDPILGLLPGFGDILSLALSFYIIIIAMMLRVPSDKISSMIKNIILDFLIGLLPVIGDVADIFYKANKKNLQIIHEHLGNTKHVVEGELV
jgi:hypothetical protein